MSTQFIESGWPIDPRSQRFIYDEVTKNIADQEHNQAVVNRLQNNKLQNYDEVIAISEETLNTTLRLRYSNLLKKKKDIRLRQFNHVIPSYGVMKAELAAPHLQLVVNKNGGQTVQFFVNFKSGTFEWWRGTSPADFQKFVQKVDGWSVALNVNFNETQLARIPNPIHKKISTMTAGTYSVSQILLTLSNASAASINVEASNFPNTPNFKTKRDMYDLVIGAFKRYFEQYLIWLGRGPYSVLGYTIKVNKTTDSRLPQEFQPTKVFLRTQSYTPSTQAFKDHFPSTKRPIRGGLDALLFLQMTGSNALPREADYNDTLPTQWVTGKVDCSLTMSKRVFWDGYLAAKFSEFNLQTLSIANDIWWWIRSNDRGLNRPWKLTDDGMPTTAGWNLDSRGASFTWDANGNQPLGNRQTDTWITFIGNSMRWKPGTDEVDISMLVDSTRRVFYDGGMFHNVVELKWDLKLRLNTIKDGKLETAISGSPPSVRSKQYNDTSKWWNFGDDDMKDFEKKTEEAVKEALAKRDFTKDLSAVLNDKSKFIFPGAGEFAMREPKFNNQGDLQLGLTLKGEDILVDDTFHLVVNAEGLTHHGRWVQVVPSDGGAWKAVLVNTQAEGTEFQISDGYLVVDVQGMPSGPRASAGDSPDSESNMRPVVFNSHDESENRTEPKCEFSVTGSEFLFSRNDGETWNRRFFVKDDSLGFLFGDPSPYDEDADLFMLDAVY